MEMLDCNGALWMRWALLVKFPAAERNARKSEIKGLPSLKNCIAKQRKGDAALHDFADTRSRQLPPGAAAGRVATEKENRKKTVRSKLVPVQPCVRFRGQGRGKAPAERVTHPVEAVRDSCGRVQQNRRTPSWAKPSPSPLWNGPLFVFCRVTYSIEISFQPR